MKTWLVVVLAAVLASAAAAQGNGSVATLLDPDSHLVQARSAFGGGQEAQALKHLQVALELAPVGSNTWLGAYQLAMEKRSGVFAQALLGTNFPVPLALMPEDDVLYSPDDLFAIPPYGPLLGALTREQQELFNFYLKERQWLNAVHVIEEALDKTPNNITALLLCGNIYERHGELALAAKRYEEAIAKARLIDDDAVFVGLFGIFRTRYRRQDFKTAEAELDRYIRAARAHFAEVLEKYKTSPGGRGELFTAVLEGRRHLVEGINALGIIKALRKADPEALYQFEQARLMAPGSIPIAFNHNVLLQRSRMAGSARQTLSNMANALSQLEQGLVSLLDRTIDAGSVDLAAPLTYRELLRHQVARVRVRQAIFELAEKEPRAAEGHLVQATSLAETSAIAHYFLGKLRQDQDRLDEALTHLKRAMTSPHAPPRLRSDAKKRVDAVFELQALRLQQARTRDDQLKEHLEEKLDPAQLQIYRRDLADCVEMLQRGEFERARQHLIRLSEYYKDNLELYRWLGFANQEQTRFKDALIAYDKALAIDKHDPWTLSQKAIVLYEYLNDLPNALDMADEAMRIKQDDPFIMSNLGWLLAMSSDLKRGAELLKRAIEKAPKDPRHHFRLGMAYYNGGLHSFASTKFKETLGLVPKHPKANVFLGITLARLGRTNEAIDQLSTSIEIVKDDEGLKDLVVKNLALLKGGSTPAGTPGPKAGNDKQLPLTRDQIARVSDANARIETARDLIVRGELAEARVVMENAHRDYPTSAEVAYNHAFLLIQAGGAKEREAARAVLSGMLDVNTQEVRAYHALAHLYFVDGKLTEFGDTLARIAGLTEGLAFSTLLDAVGTRWEQVLDLDRGDQKAIEELGRIRLHQGRLVDAREILSKGTTPGTKLLLGEVLLRVFHRDHKQLDFQQAQEALQQGAYAHTGALDGFWNGITKPKIADIEKVIVVDERAIPPKEMEGWWRMSQGIKDDAASLTKGIDHIDADGMGLHNRRWAQLDQSRRRKIEAQEAARNREAAAKQRDKKEREERENQQRIRKNLGGTATASAGGRIDGALGAVVVGESEAPRQQLKTLAGKQLAAGLDFVKAGRLPDAVREFRAAISLDPNNPEGYQSLAMALTVSGEAVRAKPVLQAAQVRFGSDRTTLALAAHAAWASGDVPGAARVWAAVRELPEPKPAKKPRGRKPAPPPEPAYVTVSRKAWQRIAAESPGDLDAHVALAQLELFAGRPVAAMKRLERHVDTIEGASAYAEACLFAALAGDDAKAVAKALAALERIEGSESFALQKRLRALAAPRAATASVR